MGIITNVFIDSTEFSGATAVYSDIDLMTKAPDGYYTYGTLNRRQIGGLLEAGVECSTIEPCETPVDCVVSEWSDWSACSGGIQTRTRTIITPASGGGIPCPVLEETRTCETPVDCVVSTITSVTYTPNPATPFDYDYSSNSVSSTPISACSLGPGSISDSLYGNDSTIPINSYVYTNPGMTLPFVGNLQWYFVVSDVEGPISLKITNSGQVIDKFTC
jgi:hypothetical protein